MRTRARDVMTTNPISVQEDLPVAELSKLLAQHRISGAPVLNRKQQLVGVVSASDIVANESKVGKEVISESQYYARPDIATRREMAELGIHLESYSDSLVQDIMTPVVISAPPETSLEGLAEMMGMNRIHRVLITEGDRLVGVVSALDLIGHVRASRPQETREILWATDLGPSSDKVGHRAIQLARELGARLTVLHVSPDLQELWKSYGDRPEVMELQQSLEERALAKLDALLQSLEHELASLQIIGRTGDPADVILRSVEERKPAFLVIGSERPQAERIRGLGSVADKVLRFSPSPVLTVPRGA